MLILKFLSTHEGRIFVEDDFNGIAQIDERGYSGTKYYFFFLLGKSLKSYLGYCFFFNSSQYIETSMFYMLWCLSGKWTLSEDKNDRKDGLWIWGLFEEPKYPFLYFNLGLFLFIHILYLFIWFTVILTI